MKKNLVIVESPAKSKTIQKYLGVNYQVEACMGHVRDLPQHTLGIDIEHHFEPQYSILPQKIELIEELKKAAKKSDTVYLATDLDREGEAIAWHLAEALQLKPAKIARVIFNEITKHAIVESFKNPQPILMHKVYAQQARRVLDRLVGYQLSPLLWKKFVRGLSAGRVQSVAVKIIVDKELEIQAFKSTEYWKILASLKTQKSEELEAELKQKNHKKLTILTEEQVKSILQEIQQEPFIIDSITQKEKDDKALPPFTTSLLQQNASTQLGFSTKHTMSLAQQLYEGIEIGSEGATGLITYMRTDSFHVSQEAIADCRKYIGETYPPEFLPHAPNKYATKTREQGAHEAIRPTSVYRTPKELQSYLSKDQYRLYKLIWERFVASQMTPAKVSNTTVIINTGNYNWECKGRQLLFPGYQIVLQKQETDKKLPDMKEKEELIAQAIQPSQHFTQPPARYTEAGLVKILEEKGIGRPSTYSPIISTIQDRGYVSLNNKAFYASELGIKVTEQLKQFFPEIMDFSFTSGMEDKLDQIEADSIIWFDVVQEFYDSFSKRLAEADKKMESLKKNPEISEYTCELCGAPMVYKYNKKGKFLGCSNFPKCHSTLSIDENGKPIYPEKTDFICPVCGKNMVIRTSKTGRFLGCMGYPECTSILPLGIDGKPIYLESSTELCPICGSAMQQKKGPHGFFLGCSKYPKCPGTRSLIPDHLDNLTLLVPKVCESCGKPMTIKMSKRGIFLGCTGYPECKQMQHITKDSLVIPKDIPAPICPICKNQMNLKYTYKGFFWACSQYPACKHIESCTLSDLSSALENCNHDSSNS